MKPIITVDIETYSPQDIKAVGAYRYAQDPEFQILLLGYANENSDTPRVLDLTSWPDTKHFLREQLPWLLDASYTKRAHNAAFEWWCLSEAMGLDWAQRVLWLQQWECSMVHALYCGLPAQLGALGAALKQPEDALKMKEGKALITYFCKPCKPTKRNGGRTRNLPQHDPEKWALFKRYNGMDVIAERANDRKLAPWPVPEEIMQQWREDVEMNALGVAVDMELVEGALACSALITEEQTAECKALTGLANPGSRAQLLGWLHNRGVELPGLTKEDVTHAQTSSRNKECHAGALHPAGHWQHQLHHGAVWRELPRGGRSRYRRTVRCRLRLCPEKQLRDLHFSGPLHSSPTEHSRIAAGRSKHISRPGGVQGRRRARKGLSLDAGPGGQGNAAVRAHRHRHQRTGQPGRALPALVRGGDRMSGPINLGIHWDPNFRNRTEAGFQRLQKEADGEFIRLVTPYVPVRTGALRGSAKDSTVLGSGLIRHTTPYAAAQYYRLPCGQGVREDGAGPHWGERCVDDHKEDFVSFVKTRAKEVNK